MLVCSADHARANRERRPATLAPPEPSLGAWQPGTTYAEIVKGHGSRSASPAMHRMQYDIKVSRDTSPEIQSETISDVQIFPAEIVETSEPSVLSECVVSECETFPSDANVYYDSEIPYYTEQQNKYEESEVQVSNVFQSDDTIMPLSTDLSPIDRSERSISPSVKYRSQDLSYAEILALGLRKQVKTQTVTSLPKPQVAQVEMVKEIVVEVQKSSPVNDFKIQSKDTIKLKSDKIERPSQRSRSRDMPRQRRAPEKRSTKAHDMQTLKKKKIAKKAMEVLDFEDNIELIEAEKSSPKMVPGTIVTDIPDKTVNEEKNKIIQQGHISEKIIDVDNSNSEIVELEQRKSKKKHKTKKPKSSEDEIERALKEIEESNKHKKKKIKDSTEKNKDIASDNLQCKTLFEPVDFGAETKESDTVAKNKKKKAHKKNQDKLNKPETHDVEISNRSSIQNVEQQELDVLCKNVGTVIKASSEEMTNEILEIKSISPIENEAISTQIVEKLQVTEDIFSSKIALNDMILCTEDNAVPITELALTKQKKKRKTKKHEGVLCEDKNKPETYVNKSDDCFIENVDNQEISKMSGLKSETVEKDIDLIKEKDKPTTLITCANEKVNESKKKSKSKKASLKDKQFLVIEKHLKDNQDTETSTNEYGTDTKFKYLSKSSSDDSNTLLKKIESSDSLNIEDEDKPILVQETKAALINPTNKLSIVSKKSTLETKSFKKSTNNSSDALNTNIITMDWNTLMEEENITFEPLTITEGEPPASDSPKQRASEVLIIQGSTEGLKTEEDNEIDIDVVCEKVQDISDSITVQSVASPLNEQNNNDKFFSTETHKEPSMNVVEEITHYKIADQDQETRKIYLITHEEKKLPPIRTVKVFNSKANSIEETSQRNSENEPIEIIDAKDNIISDNNADFHIKKKIEDSHSKSVLEFEKNNESVEGLSVTVEPINIVQSDAQTSTGHISEVNKDKDLISCNIGVVRDSSSHNLEDDLLKELEGSVGGDDILEQAIFGSVQKRKRPIVKSKYVPYQELFEEIKSYAIGVNFEQLDNDYYNFISNQRRIEESPQLDTEDKTLPDFCHIIKQLDKVDLQTMSDVEHRAENVNLSAVIPNLQSSKYSLNSSEEEFINSCSKPEISKEVWSFEKENMTSCYQDLQDSERRYGILMTSKFLNEYGELSSANCINSFTDDTKTNINQDNLKQLAYEIVDFKEDIPPRMNVQTLDQSIKKYENLHEQINYNYQNIADAENILGTINTNKSSITSESVPLSVQNSYEDVNDHMNRTDNTFVSEQLLTSKNNNSSLSTDDFENRTKSTLKNDVNVLTGTFEIPKHNYQDITDAERLFALTKVEKTSKKKISNQCVNDQPNQNYQEILSAEKLFGVLKTRELVETPIQDHDYQRRLDIQKYDKNDRILSKLNKNSDEEKQKSDQHKNIFMQGDTFSRNYLYIDSPRQNYQELVDAEKILANNQTHKTKMKPELYNIDDKITLKSTTASTVNETHCDTNMETLSYHEIYDAEKTFALTRNSMKETTCTNLKELNKCSKLVDSESSPLMDADISQIIEEKNNKVISEQIADKTEDINLEVTTEAALNSEISQNVQNDEEPLTGVETKIEDTILAVTIQEKVMPEKTEIEYTIDLISQEISSATSGENIDSTSEKLEDQSSKIYPYDTEIIIKNEQTSIFDKISELETTDIRESLVSLVYETETVDKIDELSSDMKSTENEMNLDVTEEEHDEFVVIQIVQEDSRQPKCESMSENACIIQRDSSIDLVEEPNKITDDKIENLIYSSKIRENEEKSEVSNIINLDLCKKSTEIVKIEEDFEIITNIPSIGSDVQLEEMSPNSVPKSNEPESISAAFINMEKISLLSKIVTEPVDTQKPIIDQENKDFVLTNITPESDNDIQTKNTNTTYEEKYIADARNKLTRPEKSPIHSLHDLLPEIDSIPEFKPSYSSTILYSNLSADAPEFTPSYMYRNLVPGKDITSDVDSDTKNKDNTEENVKTTECIVLKHENVPKTMSYSAALGRHQTEQTELHLSVTEKEELQESTVILTQNVQETHVESKSKRNKKKKKEHDKKETIVCSQSPNKERDLPIDHIPMEPLNIWAKAAEDGKSYAEVLAEGLVALEQKDTGPIESVILKTDEIDFMKTAVEDIVTLHEPEISDEKQDENSSSWAKIVASNRPSPERVNKLNKIQSEVHNPLHKAPVILVNESDVDVPKLDILVDAEGFITVDRNRRSRSRSRETRSASVSQMAPNSDVARDKSENRFDALTYTLKPERDLESIPSSLSDEEKESVKKGRKSRHSKSKEKEIPLKSIAIGASTSDEEKPPLKKDKKKRSSKSKDKTSKPAEKIIPIVNETKEKVENYEQEIKEPQKKSKKKKKDRKSDTESKKFTDTSTVELTSSEHENVEVRSEMSKNVYKTPLSTPESLHTPVKDRFFSEAQYWKVDPSELNILDSATDVMTIEILESNAEESNYNIRNEEILQTNVIENPNKKSEDFNDIVISKVEENMYIPIDKISDDQSLENKIADIQREIEELLLPENDNSTASDEIPFELTETNVVVEELQDEIFDNMTPSLASPECDESTSHQPSSNYKSNPEEHSLHISKHKNRDYTQALLEDTKIEKNVLQKSLDSTLQNALTDEYLNKIEVKPIEEEVLQKLDIEIQNISHTSINNFVPLTTNIIPQVITNNLTDLKSDAFWCNKFVTDDAEKILGEQNSNDIKVQTDTNAVSLENNHKLESNLKYDQSFWPEKHLYHDAECQYFMLLANKTKTVVNSQFEILPNNQNDKDRDPDGRSGHSSDAEKMDPRQSNGSPFDSNYISMDLPGGICSWKDHSSYLSLETPSDSLTGPLSEETPRLDVDIPEDKLTTLSLEPVSVPTPKQEESAEERILKTAKDDLSNDIETLLEEVKIVQANLSDLPDESLDAMEAGLREGISILVKCEEAASLLEQKIMDFRQESEVQALLKELVMIKARISKLLSQARHGLTTIQNAKTELAHQNEEIEQQMEKIVKLDNWLEDINLELKQSTKHTEILTEDDIIKYMEIYERYIREYEEYEILIQSIIVLIRDDSSQLKEKLNVTRRNLDETKNLVIIEIERLRQLLIHIRIVPEVIEDDISQTDRTIDSTSMPEEVVSPREREEQSINESKSKKVDTEEHSETIRKPDVKTQVEKSKLQEIPLAKPSATIETQTGTSLMSDTPELADKSVICQPEEKITHDVSITCAPPQEVEIQTSEAKSDMEILENIQVKQTISEGHETIEIASRPVVRDPQTDQSLYIDAYYKDDDIHKDSKLNIIHSLPQSFETVMVEPDETTTEVVVDADGTKKIIVKKVRKTLVTRQQVITSEPKLRMLSAQDIPKDQSCSQLVLTKDEFSTPAVQESSCIKYIDYQNYDGTVLSAIPGGEVEIHELTTRPDMIIAMENELKPEEIFQIAEGEIQPHVQTSSSSVTAIVQQVTKRIVKSKRRIIRRVVIIDGKEHVTEEVIEEPENIEISEEQIPRVSINVIESGATIKNSDDKPEIPPDTGESDSPQDQKHDDGDESINKNITSKKTPTEEPSTKFLQEEKEQKESSHTQNDSIHNISRTFIEREIESKDLMNTTINIKNTDPEAVETLKTNIEPQFSNEELRGNNLTIVTDDMSALDANLSTVVQHMTTKVTRMKRRIIKHIKIIDGKEHITEEVTEEPEDTLFIEDQPMVYTQERAEIIDDGDKLDEKEYVTDAIVENLEVVKRESPDKENKLKLTERQIHKSPLQTDISDIAGPSPIMHSVDSLPDTVQDTSLKPENIEQKLGIYYQPQIQTVLTTTRKHVIRHINIVDGKEHVTEEIVEDPENIQIFEGKPESTQEHTLITRTRKRIIKHIQIIDGKEHITEEVIEEPDEINILETEPNMTRNQEDTTKKLNITQEINITDGKDNVTVKIFDKPEDNNLADLNIVPQIDVEDIIKCEPLEQSIEVDSAVEKDNDLHLEEAKSKEIQHPDPREKEENQSIDDVSHLLIKSEIDHSSSLKLREPLKDVKSLERTELVHKTLNEQILEPESEDIASITRITKTNRRIIRYINNVNGEERVIEEVIDEPDDIEFIKSEPITHVLQEKGNKTKGVKVTKQIKISDGKEYITENVKEDSNNEYIPDSTVTTTINVNILKLDPINSTKDFIDNENVDSSFLPEKINKNTDTEKMVLELFKEKNKKDGDQNTNVFEETELLSEENIKNINTGDQGLHDEDKLEKFPSKSSEEPLKPGDKTHKFEDDKSSDVLNVESTDVTKIVPTDLIDSDVNIVGKISKMVTKTKKRMIKKHIKIIDGKEHITEEIIEEPDDIQVIELEPKLTSFLEELETESNEATTLQNVQIIESQITNAETEEPIDENILKTSITRQVDLQHSPQLTKNNEILSEMSTFSPVKQSVEAESFDDLPPSFKSITEQFLSQESAVVAVDKKTAEILTKEMQSSEISPTILELEAKQSNLDSAHLQSDDKEKLSPTHNVSPMARIEVNEAPLKEIIQDIEQETKDSTLISKKESQNSELEYTSPTQSPLPDEPLKTLIIESDSNINVEEKELNTTKTYKSAEITEKYLSEDLPLSQIIQNTGDLYESDVVDTNKERREVATFIESERMDTHLRQMTESLNVAEKRKPEAYDQSIDNCSKLLTSHVIETNTELNQPSQTIDISMSLKKSDANMKIEPNIETDIKIQEFEIGKPALIKKDIRGYLPADINITEEYINIQDSNKKQDDASQFLPVSEEFTSDAKNYEILEESELEPHDISLETEYIAETDRSIGLTESSSLRHYVELQTPTCIDSPRPTEILLEVLNLKDETGEPTSLSTEVDQIEEKGYEPEDISLGKELTPEKKKKHKKRKSHAISEETVYPKQTTTDDDTIITSPIDIEAPILQRKVKSRKGRKKIQDTDKAAEEEPETKPESPKIGSEFVTTPPQDESYHTLSETSDINTVKIVEECIGSSPEIIEKEVSTTVTYPVPIVEEIATTEYSIQTSPEIQESVTEDKTSERETIDFELQTSPTPVNEAIIQTTPIDDKEAHTQTIEDITICEKIEVLDSQIQTSRTDTPEPVVTSEVTTQVIARDIEILDDKFSQTSSPEIDNHKEIVEKKCRDIQTSPLPKTEKEEKSTEIITETMECVMQTDKQEVKDQETLTSPIKPVEIQEVSIQTPEVPLVTTYTQFDLPTNELELISQSSPDLPEMNLIAKIETIDNTQQTSPRDSEEASPDFNVMKKEIVMIDNVQQTSPRIESHSISPILDYAKKEIVSIDSTQQTSPRDSQNIPLIAEKESSKTDVMTIDSTQQTSPRDYTEDSMSTSTDEPYEVHLRAQISIPQTTNEFIQNERQSEQILESPSPDTHKQRKKKTKRKAESPLQSPSSLSDPINAELSLSVTSTSDDLLSKDASSIDEGISQLASPVYSRQQNQERHIATSRPTYSDVVQRSKSKSPSPCKTVFVPKDEKTRLINAMEKRTQSLSEPQRISENALTVALIEPAVEKAYDLIVNKELEEVKNAVKNNDTDKIEKSIIVVIDTISIWLEEVQYKIQTQTLAGESLSDQKERVKLLENYVQNLKRIVYVTEVNEEIIILIETLTRQVIAVNDLNTQTSVLVKENQNEWNTFLSDVNLLSQSVEALKIELDNLILSETPTLQKLDNLDKFEIENVNNADSAKKLLKIYRNFIEINPKKECPSDLYACNDDIKQIENTISTERERLLQLSSLAEEYEQTLQDFGQITDVAEALLDGKIIVSNLDHLHEEIQKHRKFFVNLSHCRAILESLEDNLDNETRTKYASLHHSLHDRATIIIDRAASRAQQMTLAASRWSVLDQSMKEEKQWLRVAEQRIPDLSNVTSMDNEQYINLYQSISLDSSQHHAKMLRLISITEGLQGLIVCSGLESECSVALDSLLNLQEEVDSRLTRLTAFRENWLTYDHLIDRIEGWMKLANKELEHITPENITTTSNLRRFWELKAQHEVHNNLKNESGVQFEKALEILPISDEMVQRQFFSKIEDKWRDLSSKISNIHTTAIANISDRDVPSSEKLNILEDEMRELRSMLDSLKGVIKSEDELNLYIERLQVMTCRIDRIQNELGRLSLLPTAESERLGALLTQSGILDDQIAEELERSLLLKEKIVQVQAGIARCQKSQRRARLTLEECEAAERLGSDVVEGASQTCEKLIEDLSAQWRDILALRQALHTLPTALRVCVSPIGVERDISGLQDNHSELEAACNELSVRLRSKLQLWRRFERQLEMVQGAVREADYMVELLTVQGQVDYDRLLKATEKLENLSESLSRRSGELVGSLREAAAPLQATTEATVAAQLRKELDDAATAYEHTCSNLTQLCEKYHKAVDLWRRYREAAACVRAFAEHHEGVVHSLRPNDAPAAQQACLEQEARVAELRSLAARVAAETGSRALQADADALARRLQLVSGAVQALADLGEARQLARAKAQNAKDMFCDMKQDLTPVQEDGEIVEDKLIALRDNLIALGKSEADIAPAKAELPDIDRDVSDEHSIVRILELWQAMFRDTFLHYHRLSTALVRSGDAATALRLWHEYLLDLQSFLSGTVPADYENLTEHRRLCRVHRNLLTSQRSVLMNENRETKNRDLVDKFDTLTNLHNETLARIVERHDEVCTRIAAWDEYREIYTELLRWLKEIEREKEKLQLRYVHIKRVNKILTNIQNLADKLPEGRKLSDKLLQNLKKILVFTEETYAASVRMEYAGIVKRVDNLQASLDTWRDFLTRILGLIGEYEKLTNDLQKLYTKTQSDVMSYSDEDRLSRPQIKKANDRYSDLRTKIDRTETQIEALSVIQEQLKECLSPQDIRIVSQKVWQLRQQRADLEHQLSIIIHKLQERLEIYTLLDSRLSRFSEWMTALESRLDIATSSNNIVALDPQDLVRRLTSDIQAETGLKEREFEWLIETGSTLVDLSKKDEKSYSKNTAKLLKDVQERWHKLLETGRNRITKINDLLETISKLEERLTEIRMKLHTIESSLTTTVVIEHLTTKSIDAKFTERDDIHKNIENESGEVGKTLNLCELVFNDPDVLKGNFDLRNLRTGADIVEKKWKNICDMSEQRKKALKEIRKSAELVNSLLPKVEKKLDAIEKRVEKIETRKQRGEAEDESISKNVIKDLDALESDIKKLEYAYSRIVSARGVEVRGSAADEASRLRSAVRKWQQLRGRLDAAGADAHKQFVSAHGKAVVTLAEADVRLTRALHLAPAPTDKIATLKELDGVEEDLRECAALVDEADRLSVSVSSIPGVSDMVGEYRALFADVRTRLDIAKAEVVGDVDSAVQVDTLKWETDASLQVDTLTSKETYRSELATAVKESSDSIEALRTALLQEIKEDAKSDELATAAKEIAKAGTKPEQTLELAKHLSELLLTECDATEDEAMLKEVESLSLRYEDLLTQAKKRELQINNLRLPHSASYALTCEHESGRLTCPLCSDRNWKQLDNDLWRLEQWLQFAEATDEARIDPPEQYDALEDAIQDHREFLLDLDSHKALVVSLNVVGAHVTRHARSATDARRVQERLAAANTRWDTACARAAAWQGRLQTALVNNREFHDIVVELVSQLAAAEKSVRAREPLRLTRPAPELRKDFRRFSELRDELSRAEPRVLALRDAAQLLTNDAQDVCRRLGELRLRLQSLRKLSGVYALKLGAALARSPQHGSALAAAAATAATAAQLMEEEPPELPPLDESLSEEHEEQQLSSVQRGLRFVSRVARASLPFQALLLLLLGAAALAPLSPGDCRGPPSLQPVLRYPHGPPPL